MDLEKKSMGNMTGKPMRKKIFTVCCAIAFLFTMALNLSGCTPKVETDELTDSLPEQSADIPMDDSTDGSAQDVGAAEGTTANVNVPVEDEDLDKMIAVPVGNLGRANPFLPPGESAISNAVKKEVASIPQEKLKYDVLPPLESPAVDNAAKKVVSTKVSGIMYDKVSPSAILNIDGLDYFVRSGDIINGYKVLSITKSVVTVQMGANIYKAGIGQMISETNHGVNFNQVADLSNKFGGAGRK